MMAEVMKRLAQDIIARDVALPRWRSYIALWLFDVGFRTVLLYRLSRCLSERQGGLNWLSRLAGRIIAVRLCRSPGVEIRSIYEVGPGLLLPHAHDIVIGKYARIGRSVTIYNGVTIGARAKASEDEVMKSRYPEIGDYVVIFPGAKILGAVSIGAGSVIGTNAVVLISCPPGSTLVGVPARILPAKAASTGLHLVSETGQ